MKLNWLKIRYYVSIVVLIMVSLITSSGQWLISLVAVSLALLNFYAARRQLGTETPAGWSWRSDYALPISFIIFFLLAGMILGEYLPSLPVYFGDMSHHPKVSILDTGGLGDMGVVPVIYAVFGSMLWVLYRLLNWRLVWLAGVILGTLAELFLFRGDQRPEFSSVFGAGLFFTTVWSVISLVPYFSFESIDRRWGSRGRWQAIGIGVLLHILFLSFFAFEIHILHHSFRYLIEPSGRQENGQSKADQRLTMLPELQSFANQKTDQFPVDMNLVKSGHPFKGQRAATPHTGAHIHFEDDFLTWPQGGTSPTNYPPIYAVADGVVGLVTNSLKVGSNDRYGINLAIAKDGQTIWDFEYSIEPMVPEPAKDFYRPFILVKEGDRVKKGQVIGYMYLPKNANGTHIHFELIAEGSGIMKPPAIFTPAIVQSFHDHWAGQGLDGERGQGTAIPACMGWLLAIEENPFANQAVDCLK